MSFRPHGTINQAKLQDITFCNQVTNLRYFSNTRPPKSRESSKFSGRSQLNYVSRAQQSIPQSSSQATRSTCNKIKGSTKKIHSYENTLEMLKECRVNDESLFIESLYAVPKVRRLNPIREKLIRLFNCSGKERVKSSEKAVIACENLEWMKDEVETPSPVIKPKYTHKG